MAVLVATLEHDEDIERLFTEQVVEVRGGRSGGPRRIGGYASVFGKLSMPLQNFVEIVEPSFFDRSKADGWPGVVCRFDHSNAMLLGATASGTLRLSVDGVGLDYTADLPECRADVWEMVSRGDLRNSSFAFQVVDDDFTYNEGYPVRHLISGRLIDVAPVVVPAYPDATVALRSFARHRGVPVEDVVEYQQRGELRKFLPSGGSRKRKTWHQREVELMAMTLDPVTNRPYGKPLTKEQDAVEKMRPKSGRQALLETLELWEP